MSCITTPQSVPLPYASGLRRWSRSPCVSASREVPRKKTTLVSSWWGSGPCTQCVIPGTVEEPTDTLAQPRVVAKTAASRSAPGGRAGSPGMGGQRTGTRLRHDCSAKIGVATSVIAPTSGNRHIASRRYTPSRDGRSRGRRCTDRVSSGTASTSSSGTTAVSSPRFPGAHRPAATVTVRVTATAGSDRT
jgi:hypothetical protein